MSVTEIEVPDRIRILVFGNNPNVNFFGVN
jgi:hypothetical protein